MVSGSSRPSKEEKPLLVANVAYMKRGNSPNRSETVPLKREGTSNTWKSRLVLDYRSDCGFPPGYADHTNDKYQKTT